MKKAILLTAVGLGFQSTAFSFQFREDFGMINSYGNYRGYVPPASVWSGPVYTAPIVQEPVYTAPVYTAPVVQAPVYTPPVVAAPVYTPPPVAVAPVGNGCQSATLCVHASMPSLSQRDTTSYATGGYYENSYNKYALGFDSNQYNMGLLEYVNQREGLNLPYNAGWCGGVAAAMVVKAYAVQVGGNHAINLNDTNVNSFTYNVMKLVGTKIRKGGTDDGDVRSGFRRVAGVSNATSLGSVASFNASKPYLYVNLNKEHAVAINGTDAGYFLVYDPHGRIFSAQLSGNRLQWVKNAEGSKTPYYSNIRINSVISMGR